VVRPSTTPRDILAAIGLAVCVAGGLYVLVGSVNLNLADEGFLWYGVIRTRAGDVPLRDFQSYDPGRYYWCVASSFLSGQGILGLRASLAAVQGVGLFLGLLVCRRVTSNLAALAGCAVVLAAWWFPRHKSFEPAFAVAAVWIAVRLIEKPSTRRVFEAGIFTGIAAWFGRNLALYSALACASAIALLLWKGRLESFRSALTSFVLGGVAGSIPLWSMLLLVPGFAAAFADAIWFNLTTAVNLPLPYPWPWRFDLHDRHGFDLLADVSTALAFALPFVLYPVGLAIALATAPGRLSERAVIIGATLVGIFFLHHAAVRSDVGHLAHAIHPLLMLSFAMAASVPWRLAARLSVLAIVVAMTVCATLSANPAFALVPSAQRASFVAHDVAGDSLRLPAAQATYLTNLEAAIRTHVGRGDSLFVAPALPGLYPIFDKKSPDWWLYFLWPATEAMQRRTIERLEGARVEWALILDHTMDGRDDLRFRNSNALVWDYLNRSFARIDDLRLEPNHWLMRRRPR
jgi:hypothetical protein